MAFSKDLVAKRLKAARLKAKISQKKLGIAAGIDEFSASARMNQYESGKYVPNILTLKQIAIVLHLPLAYFYAEDDMLAELLVHLGRATTAQKKKLLLFFQKNLPILKI